MRKQEKTNARKTNNTNSRNCKNETTNSKNCRNEKTTNSRNEQAR